MYIVLASSRLYSAITEDEYGDGRKGVEIINGMDQDSFRRPIDLIEHIFFLFSSIFCPERGLNHVWKGVRVPGSYWHGRIQCAPRIAKVT